MKTFYLVEESGNLLVLHTKDPPGWLKSSGWDEDPVVAFTKTYNEFIRKAKNLAEQMELLRIKHEKFMEKMHEYNLG